ncbi:protein kinase [Kutzneria sp. 744]|uniref:protein kinase domain-containing protein n=1 Tax=Kutzneria sp. (strain 744) TaxID=345341 RepID=UPI0003EEBFC9|nr:protein kinase [Kutzneria sp. 744]EWM12180.1 LigA protein [Kutzneria sp. 744]
MTAFGGGPATVCEDPRADAATVVGHRQRDANDTEVEPGREHARSDRGRALPAGLATRFELVRDLAASAQGDVYLVRERDGAGQRVVKLYRLPSRLADGVTEYLPRRRSRHIVAVEEIGEEAGRQYEIMEYLAGGSLLDLRDRNRSGVDTQTIETVVRQLAEALGELHGENIVHRDLKPANVLVRGLEPLDVALADFGISWHSEYWPCVDVSNDIGTVPFTPPEFLVGAEIAAAFDWWSLGMTVLELAIGRPAFPNVDNPMLLRSRVAGRPVPVDDVPDERIRLLCSGLLTMDPEHRWGPEQVARWLAGESPPVAAAPPPSGGEIAAGDPFVFAGAEYHTRSELAVAMYDGWETARATLFEGRKDARDQLRAWLGQFADYEPPPKLDRGTSADVRLLYELRAMHAGYEPIYRHRRITVAHLPLLAHDAVQRIEASADIVADLWRARLLPVLSEGSGGDGLREVWGRWQDAVGRQAPAAGLIPDRDARAELRRILHDEPFAWALALHEVTATVNHEREARDAVGRLRHRAGIPWFAGLADRHLWLAYALSAYAERQANQHDRDERARLDREARLRRTARQREWSHRQNRPYALGYAVTGVAAVAVLLFVLVGISDWVGIATDAQIVDAWFAVSAALVTTTLAESLLAWETGGRFHPRYSFLGAGAMALGRASRTLLDRRAATPVVLAALALLAALTIYLPAATPLVLCGSMLVWTVRRHARYREDLRHEREIVAGG